MKLYVMPGSCALSCHIALEWTGTPYELEVLDHAALGGAAYRAVNPKAQVPALRLDNGAVVTEALACLLLIAEQHPGTGIGAAADPLSRARLNEILAELVSDVHPAFGPMFAPGRFVTQPGLEGDAKAAAFRRIDARFDRLETLLAGRPWLLDHRSVADAYLYVLTRWKGMTPTPLDAYPALAAFKARMDADPAVRRALAAEGAS